MIFLIFTLFEAREVANQSLEFVTNHVITSREPNSPNIRLRYLNRNTMLSEYSFDALSVLQVQVD